MMQPLSELTPLIDALSIDEAGFDRLVVAYPVYRRFAGVLMREDTATRLSLVDIAHLGGITPAAVLAAACGTAGAPDPHGQSRASLPAEGRPAWAEGAGEAHARFDARPLLEAGHEPLPDLLDFVEDAPDAVVLVVDFTLHPQPLRRLLEGRDYDSAAECLGPDHWRVYLRRRAEGRR
ncbi:hypothetical protein [Microvirga sp. CF3016]|uniref:hypothetical protein n=1 Tax=Microvirga sp. CF3016 TaxID=3110181 RepID=UPI002E75B0DB|nr:hypothetical protein [Microvirga sp. CF3016]MEE1609887.1 hypothetical protein [Microvirga sp. CF3016]